MRNSSGRLVLILILVSLFCAAENALPAPHYVNGLVPDWNQPYRYIPASPYGGPGPDPVPIMVNQWNDWCAPSSAANLAGYWADFQGVPVADTNRFSVSSVIWAQGPSWQDCLADGTVAPLFPGRPAPQPGPTPGPLPVPATDIGWYLDTNRGVPYDAGGGFMGGCYLGNMGHNGTFLKDMHVGLQNYLNTRYSLSGSIFWRTGTRGSAFAAGVDPSGAPAAVHPNAASAFGEVMSEINNSRPLILSFIYWNPAPTAFTNAPTGTNTESALASVYYRWGTTPVPPYTNQEDETWNFYDVGIALGHAVTCVGYIPAGDAADRGPALGLGPTDWVIVHDNWSTTMRNVIIPFSYGGAWVANTTAVPWPTAAKFVKCLVPDWNQPYHYIPPSANGGPPGPDIPMLVNQWNAWCVPTSAANLAGHWTDCYGVPVADSTAFTVSTVAWADPSWQDYLADGTVNRPPRQVAPGPLPAAVTDIGWYMDTNPGIGYDAGGGTMGGFFFGNPNHPGTFLKDVHIGLQNYLDSQYNPSGAGWDTGTEGKAFAAGLDPNGGAAHMLMDPASSFGEVMSEINRNHTLIVSYLHWVIVAAPTNDIPLAGAQATESDYGGTYFEWSQPQGPAVTNAEDETWNLYPGDMGLGHAVTAVGYIPAGDVLDPGVGLGLGPTDWVIVHDNWASTPRNVIIPFDYLGNWVANTTAMPDPGFLQITAIRLTGGTNCVISYTGIPGALHDLQYKSDMTNTSWSATAASNMTFAAGTMQVTNTVSSGTDRKFYRVKATYY